MGGSSSGTPRITVRFTRNFERNLDSIAQFLEQAEAAGAFDDLLDELFDRIVPNLERFPDLGVDFLARRPASLEAHERLEALSRNHPKQMIREYIGDQFIILYAVGDGFADLLAIRHHRQLSFDFKDLWF